MWHMIMLTVLLALTVNVMVWAYLRWTCGSCLCDRQRIAGKTVVITGGNRGIGRCCTQELCRGGARVIIGCRNTQQGGELREQCLRDGYSGSVDVLELNLQSFASVRSFVEKVRSLSPVVDVLVNNAAVGVPDRITRTKDGFEMTLQTNYLAPVLLTHLLLPSIRRPGGRIVNVSSIQHVMGSNRRLCKQQQCSTRTPLFGSFIYGDSKLALNHWTRTLAKQLNGTGITVNACHPGYVKTDIFFGRYGNLMHFTLRWLTYVFAKSPIEGAQSPLHLVLSTEAGHISGEYWSDCRVVEVSKRSLDEETAKILWTRSLEQLGIGHLQTYK